MFRVEMDNADVYEPVLYGAGALKHVELVSVTDPEMVRFKSSLHTMLFNKQRAYVADPQGHDSVDAVTEQAFCIIENLDGMRSETLGKTTWVDDLGSHAKIFKPSLGRAA